MDWNEVSVQVSQKQAAHAHASGATTYGGSPGTHISSSRQPSSHSEQQQDQAVARARQAGASSAAARGPRT